MIETAAATRVRVAHKIEEDYKQKVGPALLFISDRRLQRARGLEFKEYFGLRLLFGFVLFVLIASYLSVYEGTIE